MRLEYCLAAPRILPVQTHAVRLRHAKCDAGWWPQQTGAVQGGEKRESQLVPQPLLPDPTVLRLFGCLHRHTLLHIYIYMYICSHFGGTRRFPTFEEEPRLRFATPGV